MLMVEFFSGDWLPSHCLFVPKFVVLRGGPPRKIDDLTKSNNSFGNFKTFLSGKIKFSNLEKNDDNVIQDQLWSSWKVQFERTWSQKSFELESLKLESFCHSGNFPN